LQKALFNEAEEEEKAARDAAKAREHGLSVEQAEKMNALKKTTSALSAKGLEEEDDGDPDDEEFAFLFAKHRKGFFHRLMRSGHVLDRQEIMTYKKSLIKKALLKQNRHLDKDAVQTFKNIMSYMGDRESSRDSTRHATKLLRNVMSSPAGLRDEVFLQVCKQTTGNPKEASTLRGWELMTFFLASFPPSKPLRKFLLAYFEENKAHKEKQHSDAALQQIARFAENSIEWLPRIMSLGARKAVPSATELEALKTLRGMSIRVYFLDNTFKTFMVDSFTLVSDVLDMVVKKLAISNASIFGLYEFAETERMLNPKERVLDVYARWEEEEKERAQKEEKEQWRFVYKAKLILKPGHPEVKNDMEAINLLYMQSVMDVVSGKYPVKESHLVILAALQLQATFGDYHPEMHGHGWLIDKLEQFIPKALVALKDSKREAVVRAEFEQKIIAKYEKVKGFSAQEARLNYLDFVQQWPAYGVTHFNCQQRQFKDYPSPLLLGITCEGALLVHPETRAVLDEYKYTDIVTWGHSDDKLILVVGNVVQQRKIVFKTEEGAVINQLIHDYVKFKLAEKNSHAVAVMKKA
jgi:acyl-CoA-binding protein